MCPSRRFTRAIKDSLALCYCSNVTTPSVSIPLLSERWQAAPHVHDVSVPAGCRLASSVFILLEVGECRKSCHLQSHHTQTMLLTH